MPEKKTKKGSRLEITQVRSTSGRPEKHRRTLRALGITHHQQTIVQNDTPQIRGMVAQIPHLISVREID
jgi:large subunit ribosomal protein L30